MILNEDSSSSIETEQVVKLIPATALRRIVVASQGTLLDAKPNVPLEDERTYSVVGGLH